MVDLHSILADHTSKNTTSETQEAVEIHDSGPTVSEIPDLFFDTILQKYKLTRMEIMVLMYLYRRVWCRPNLYRMHGISQLMSHTDMANKLALPMEDVYLALRNLEEYSFISTIRSGQYFVRKYFTQDFDDSFSQSYDDFEI